MHGNILEANNYFFLDAPLRRKWKYLRDQFAIEMGKYPPCGSGYPDGHPVSKWPYFQSLLFLVDVVKPRILPKNRSQAQWDNDYPETVAYSADSGTDSRDGLQEIETKHSKQFAARDTNMDETENPVKRKRNDLILKYDCREDIEKQEASWLEGVLQERKDENDDMLFFRSLLSHVGSIPQHLKLRFRNRVLELVQEFAYPDNLNISETHRPSSTNGGNS